LSFVTVTAERRKTRLSGSRYASVTLVRLRHAKKKKKRNKKIFHLSRVHSANINCRLLNVVGFSSGRNTRCLLVAPKRNLKLLTISYRGNKRTRSATINLYINFHLRSNRGFSRGMKLHGDCGIELNVPFLLAETSERYFILIDSQILFAFPKDRGKSNSDNRRPEGQKKSVRRSSRIRVKVARYILKDAARRPVSNTGTQHPAQFLFMSV